MITAIRPGALTLRVVADATGRTRTALMQQRYPQRMTTPLYCDETYPDAATVCVQSPSGGTFSDDDLTTTVQAEPGSHLRLTTQAATQVFSGSGHGARHRLSFGVDRAATLEYLPKTLIPHADSHYTQVMDIDVDAAGCYIGWEALAAGRLGHGERFRYHSYNSAVRIVVDGRTVARDLVLLEPPSAARLVDADYLATLLVVAPATDSAALLDAVRHVLAASPVRGGASELPAAVGVLVRITTDHAPDLHRIQQLLLDTVRERVLT
ncbi:MAG: urease accessory protein UreD [Mycobacterium sp.]